MRNCSAVVTLRANECVSDIGAQIKYGRDLSTNVGEKGRKVIAPSDQENEWP